MALSEEKRHMLKHLKPLAKDILKTDISKYIRHETFTINVEQGQGKRAGHTVKGAMSIYGAHTAIFILLDSFRKDFSKEEFKMLAQDGGRFALYVHTRTYGLNHKLSFAFAMFYSLGMIRRKICIN